MESVKSIVGKSVPRLDAVEKVTGRAHYAVNVRLPGMLWGKLLRSPVPHARVVEIDVSEAQRLPGVVCIITGEHVPDRKIGRYVNDMYALARDTVRYVGDPVAAVAAVDEDTAARGVEAIKVKYEELPAVFDLDEAAKPGSPRVHEAREAYDGAPLRRVWVQPTHSGNLCSRFVLEKGNIEAAFGQADLLFEDTFTTHIVQHCHMEPHAALASVSENGDITVWTNNQRPFELRTYLADLLGLPTTKIRVIATEVGGGFGAKKAGWERFPVLLSLECGRPVKMVMTRDEEFIDGYRSVPAKIIVKTGVQRDGTMTARAVTTIWDTGAYCHGAVPSIVANFHAPGPYRIPNLRLESLLVYTNKVPGTTYRGIGGQDIAWAVEAQTDAIARKLGRDPVAFRLQNLIEDGDETTTGATLRGGALRECLVRVREAMLWGAPPKPNRGKGIACFHRMPYHTSPSSAVLWLNPDGKVTLLAGATEIGQGLKTILAQMCAEQLGVKLEDVNVVLGDTGVTPFDDGAYGSRLTEGAGHAVCLAASDARRQVLQAAAKLFEVMESDLDLKDGRLVVKSQPGFEMSLGELCLKIHSMAPGPILGRGSWIAGHNQFSQLTSQKGQEEPGWKFGVAGVEVEVDTDTGNVTVLKAVSAHDVGCAINPLLVEGQIEGAASMGLANFMLEEMQFDGGKVVNPTLMDYRLPTAADCPRVEPVIIEQPNPVGPFGAKGLGELPIEGVGAALGNAVEAAIGIRIKSSPITPEKVLQALANVARRGTGP